MVGKGVTYETEMEIERRVCVQINGDVFERVKCRPGSSGLFCLAQLPGEAATNRKV